MAEVRQRRWPPTARAASTERSPELPRAPPAACPGPGRPTMPTRPPPTEAASLPAGRPLGPTGQRERARCCSTCGSAARNWMRATRRSRCGNRCSPRPNKSSRRRVEELRRCKRSWKTWKPAASNAKGSRLAGPGEGLRGDEAAATPRRSSTICKCRCCCRCVDRMKEAKAAPVLAAMNPDKARDVTAGTGPDAHRHGCNQPAPPPRNDPTGG